MILNTPDVNPTSHGSPHVLLGHQNAGVLASEIGAAIGDGPLALTPRAPMYLFTSQKPGPCFCRVVMTVISGFEVRLYKKGSG